MDTAQATSSTIAGPLTARLDDAEREASQLHAELTEAREQNLRLTAKLARSERHNEDLVVRLRQFEQAYTSMQKRFGAVEARAAEATTNFAESEARGITFLLERDQARQQVTTLTAELEHARGTVADLTARLAAVEERLQVADRRSNAIATAEDRDREERREKAARIQRAIDDDEITMVYQPIMSTLTGRTVGIEALARFSGLPNRPPDEWFNEAAEAGMAVPLEMAAVNAALQECESLPDDVFLAVNASPQLLRSPALLHALRSSTRRVVVELTEHQDVGSYDSLRDAARAIQAAGVRLAVDDAGAGFASLEHIVKLTPDIVKLDRMLIRGLDTDPMRRSLVGKLVSFGQECGLTVVAEGVENADELAVLSGLGVDYVQGFFLGRPSSLAEALEEVPVRRQLLALAGQQAAAIV